MSNGIEIVRAAQAVQGAQRLAYAPGVTSATTRVGSLCLTVVAHNSPSDQDGIELLPELDALLDRP